MPNSGKQIYPKDCYEFLLGLCSKTGLSFYKVVNIVIREGIIRLKEKHKVEELGLEDLAISEETSQIDLLIHKKEREKQKTKEQIEMERQKLLQTFADIRKQLINIMGMIKEGMSIPEKSLRYWKQKAEQCKDLFPEANEFLQIVYEKEMLEKIKMG